MKVPEGLIDPKSYYEGYREGLKDGLDMKKGWYYKLFGYDLGDVLKILEEYKAKKPSMTLEEYCRKPDQAYKVITLDDWDNKIVKPMVAKFKEEKPKVLSMFEAIKYCRNGICILKRQIL